MKTSRLPVLLAVLVAGALVIAPALEANAGATATVKVQTQRMSDATLTSSQNGWYAKGSVLSLSCYKRGQSVKGFYSPYISGGWDNLWYQVSDGYFVADVDIDTGSNDPVTGQCQAASAPVAPAPVAPAPVVPAPVVPAPVAPAPVVPAPVVPAPAPAAPVAAAINTNNWYTLTARNSGKAVDARGASSANGTAVQQYPGNNSSAQKWQFIATDSGYYRLATALNGNQILDVTGAKATNGTKVQLWAWGSGLNQQWMAVDAGNGAITLKPRHATSRCLDVTGGSKNSSVQLQIYDCNGTTSQQFTLTAVGKIVATPAVDTSRAWGQTTLKNNGATGNCTWGAYEQFKAYSGVYPALTGDALNWYKSGKATGWSTTLDAQANSIVVFQPGIQGAKGVGHVGWVEKTEKRADGLYIYVYEMNGWSGDGGGFGIYNHRWVKDVPGMSYVLAPKKA